MSYLVATAPLRYAYYRGIARPHPYCRRIVHADSVLHWRSALPIPCPGHSRGRLRQGELSSCVAALSRAFERTMQVAEAYLVVPVALYKHSRRSYDLHCVQHHVLGLTPRQLILSTA